MILKKIQKIKKSLEQKKNQNGYDAALLHTHNDDVWSFECKFSHFDRYFNGTQNKDEEKFECGNVFGKEAMSGWRNLMHTLNYHICDKAHSIWILTVIKRAINKVVKIYFLVLKNLLILKIASVIKETTPLPTPLPSQ